MTYPSSNLMTVEKVTERNEKMFFDLIRNLSKESKDKNRDWFKYILKNDKNKFDQWYITLYKNEIIAFSCVMKINGYYRLLSRLYNCVRKKGMTNPVKYEEISPAMLMLEQQLYDYPTSDTFISMEYLNRRKLLEKLANKINTLYGGEWKLREGFYQTCNIEDSFSCWQSIISEVDLPLNRISIEEYIERFSNKRKKIK